MQGWFALMALQSQRRLTGTRSYKSKKMSPFPCLPACNHSLQTTASADVTYIPWSLRSHRLRLLKSSCEVTGSQPSSPAVLVSPVLDQQQFGCAVSPSAVLPLPAQIPNCRRQHEEIWLVAKLNGGNWVKSACWHMHRCTNRELFDTDPAPAEQAFCMPTGVTFYIQTSPVHSAAAFPVCPMGLWIW